MVGEQTNIYYIHRNDRAKLGETESMVVSAYNPDNAKLLALYSSEGIHQGNIMVRELGVANVKREEIICTEVSLEP